MSSEPTCVDITAIVIVRDGRGGETEVARKDFPRLDVMKTGVVKSWTKRQWSKAKRQFPNQLVLGRYRGQLNSSPFTPYFGDLNGSGQWDF